MSSAKAAPSSRPGKIFISAGESSGDLYASALIEALGRGWPELEWFGCAGPRMQAAGVEPIVDSRSLSVVGLVEVLHHLPRIYGEFRKLVRAVRERRPDLAILTDSPDFHLRLATKIHAMGIPVIYMVAPQAWAWRQGRVRQMRRTIGRLLCLFPFEEPFFRERGVPTTYIGHPLARLIRPSLSKQDFLTKHQIPGDRPLVALCPGSRRGEMGRHLPIVIEAAQKIAAQTPVTFVLAAPLGFSEHNPSFLERFSSKAIQVIEGETWDVLSHADLALAASGTVTMEAALLGTPLVTYYKVTGLSWLLGRFLVRVPYYSMVNLIAGRRLAPELMQNEMTADGLAKEALVLLRDGKAREAMRRSLQDEVAAKLTSAEDPMERAAAAIREFFDEHIRQQKQQ